MHHHIRNSNHYNIIIYVVYYVGCRPVFRGVRRFEGTPSAMNFFIYSSKSSAFASNLIPNCRTRSNVLNFDNNLPSI